MAQAAVKSGDEATQVLGPVLDHSHLARMTFGDASLERELLELFDRQAEILIERMRAADAASVSALAHTLKGSALGIGAGPVAQAAAAVERAPTSPAIDQLATVVSEARAAIAAWLNRT